MEIRASRTIEVGEVLGFYYGLEYWGTALTMMSATDPRRPFMRALLDRLESIEALGWVNGLTLPFPAPVAEAAAVARTAGAVPDSSDDEEVSDEDYVEGERFD
jgi:hypothetical protein